MTNSHQMSKKNSLQIHEGKGELLNLTPNKISLHNTHAIRRELASVYRDMRNGKIEAQDGTRLAYVLDMIRKSHESCVLEDRLTELERTLNLRDKP